MNPITIGACNDGINVPKVAGKPAATEMRRPPAYQTYASDDLASEAYYGLSLASRGLFDAMLRVIWVNGYVPKEPPLLAKAVRADLAEVTPALGAALLEQFVSFQSDPTRLTHPELDRQRANLERRHQQQRNGGKEGANRRYNASQSNSGKAMGRPMGSEMKCKEMNGAEKKRTRSTGKRLSPGANDATESWVQGYEEEERNIQDSGSGAGRHGTRADTRAPACDLEDA